MVCMLGLDLIASELENPFGTDANDLPTLELQHEMNRNLMCLLQPHAWDVPELTKRAVFSFKDLVEQNNRDRASLEQFQVTHQSVILRIRQGKGIQWGHTKDVMARQMRWSKQVVSDSHEESLAAWLKTSLSEVLHHQDTKLSNCTGDSLQRGSSNIRPTALTPKTSSRNMSSVNPEDGDENVSPCNSDAHEEEEPPSFLSAKAPAAPAPPSSVIPPVSCALGSKDPPLQDFPAVLDTNLKYYLDNQMRHVDERLKSLGSLQAQHFMFVQRALAGIGGSRLETCAHDGMPVHASPDQSSKLTTS